MGDNTLPGGLQDKDFDGDLPYKPDVDKNYSADFKKKQAERADRVKAIAEAKRSTSDDSAH